MSVTYPIVRKATATKNTKKKINLWHKYIKNTMLP